METAWVIARHGRGRNAALVREAGAGVCLQKFEGFPLHVHYEAPLEHCAPCMCTTAAASSFFDVRRASPLCHDAVRRNLTV